MHELLNYASQTVRFGGQYFDVSTNARKDNVLVDGLRESARDFDTVSNLLASELTQLQRQAAETAESVEGGRSAMSMPSQQTFTAGAARIAELMTRRAAAERQLALMVSLLNDTLAEKARR